MAADGHCRRSLHTFNPAPGSVKRSDLLGTCEGCQAETTLHWANRNAWNAGHPIPAVHLPGCSMAHALDFYRKGTLT